MEATMDVWHAMTREGVLENLGSGHDGLDSAEAAGRLKRYGPNQLEERKLRNPLLVLGSQFTEIMVIVLLVAAVLSFLVGEGTDAVMILIIVILNALLGFTQEYRAERAMAALKQLSVSTVRVRRDGRVQEIEATQLVPGDVFLIEAGTLIPADGRVLESANLRVEEAALTGESVPVDKVEPPLSTEDLPVGDRTNMVFTGTAAVYGRGIAVAVHTGMRTELGNIAHLLQEVGEEKTPLQRRMAELGKWLAIGALAICAVVFAQVLLQQEDFAEAFLIAVSLAVAAVPEGLPAVVTIALALGAQRMVRRNALIRRLPAVETLGSVTAICSDKTGTLTENRMTVTALDVVGASIDLVEKLRVAGPIIGPDEAPLGRPQNSGITLLLAGGALCNDAVLEPEDGYAGGYRAIGDPTEGALVVAAARHGLWREEMSRMFPRVDEVPFTSERKRMTTIHQMPTNSDAGRNDGHTLVQALPDADYIAFTKGAVDSLLAVSDRVWNEDRIEPLDDTWRRRIAASNDELAARGMRVLGVAMRPLELVPDTSKEHEAEQGLVFVGMTGMIDPPRAEVRQAVAECREAGIRAVMITGDHPLTALNIARDLGIVARDANGQDHVITGQQLARMSVQDLEAVVEDIAVYARVSPEHKVKIVEAFKTRGHFVAMTGDGVNDAPALKRADIGVAMGITGTDVSKEASDMILLDDNFATIVHAIEEGRTIYENIRKFVRYIISCNVGEIFMMLVAPLLGYPVPLTALQLLWINLVTDGLPALALGVEPADPNNMKRPPAPPDESVLARGLGPYILWVGLLVGGSSLLAQVWGINLPRPVWQTMVFTTLSLSQMGNALVVRSDRESIFTIGLFSNRALIGAVVLTITLQMVVVYVPFMQGIFDTTGLSLEQIGVTLVLSAIPFITVEIAKWIRRRLDGHGVAVGAAHTRTPV
jgi:Ca2+-transporting ATPase